MNKLTLFLVLLFVSISINAQVVTEEKRKTVTEKGDTIYTESTIVSKSEDITPREDMLVINPLKFFLFYNLSYFHKVSESVAVGAGFQIPTISGLGGVGLNAEARIYPSKKTLRGFYFAPNLTYMKLTAHGESVSAIGLGALVGWQWFPGDDFAIGLGIGIDHYTLSNDNVDDDFNSYSGSIPVVRFDIGYAW
ncbi:MAG: hypothetical protein KDC88_02015 [Ignavibacteriae bacterium]|nr:hypothetical protein [Ignavibacteriota bacterium]MCB9208330.1 hypothetical protein [Ignavibacteriales bacterium]